MVLFTMASNALFQRDNTELVLKNHSSLFEYVQFILKINQILIYTLILVLYIINIYWCVVYIRTKSKTKCKSKRKSTVEK